MHRSTQGFSLLELMISTGVFAVVMVIASACWVSALNLWEAERSHSDLNAGLRTTAWYISQELAAAAATDRDSLEPQVEGLTVSAPSPTEITFQKPLATDESVWSTPIIIRHRNEDTNGNLKRDPGEDLDENGVADRVVERLEDINGDGSFDGPGETIVLGRSIDAMAAQVIGSQLEVALTARTMGSRKERAVSHDMLFRVRLLP